MAHESFAKTVLAAVARLAADRDVVTVSDLSIALDLRTRAAHKRMLNTLSDLKNAGKIARVSQGVYALASSTALPEIREVMWRLLRMRRRVTVDDLVEMAGASTKYASDWLRMLEGREVVRRNGTGDAGSCDWQLIKDTVEMPVDTGKAAYLRELRKKKKNQIMTDLLAARELIGKACLAIKEMED